MYVKRMVRVTGGTGEIGHAWKENLPSLVYAHLVMVINPLSPDITMHILLTILHTFLMELVRRICLNIKTSYSW